jgi:RsiW-degrading membrane proteinase PrsW (M82 family)
MFNINVETLSLAIAGGILPALVWLFFWLREDRKHPEPKWLLFITFVAGMLVVLPVLKLELFIFSKVDGESLRLALWSGTEEIGKFLAAYFIVLRRKEVDEPIDYVMYLITVALGFAAVENTLFIFTPISQGLAATSIITGNLRFIGATLLHTASSSLIGISMAFAFYKNQSSKHLYTTFGIILAIALHAGFNLSIIIGGGRNSLVVASIVWITIIGIILSLEKIKKIHPTS